MSAPASSTGDHLVAAGCLQMLLSSAYCSLHSACALTFAGGAVRRFISEIAHACSPRQPHVGKSLYGIWHLPVSLCRRRGERSVR